MNKNDKILITGCCGFIGTNLIRDLLNLGYTNIIGIDNLSHGTFIEEVHGKIPFYICDIEDKHNIDVFFKDIKYVFHFAGLVSIYDCDKDPIEAFNNNVIGSINVFDLCLKYNVEKVIFSETSAIYEDCESPNTEDQFNPRTIYATTKACLHLLAESYRKTKGLTYTSLRYFNVYGPEMDFKRTVPPFFAGIGLRCLMNKQPIIFGDENRMRDFIYVDDINRFHIECMNNKLTNNQVFNLGTGKPHSLRELVDMIQEILGTNLPILYKEEINGEAAEIYANISKAKSLNWEPKVGIKEGIQKTLQYLIDEFKAGNVQSNYMDDLQISDIKIGTQSNSVEF